MKTITRAILAVIVGVSTTGCNAFGPRCSTKDVPIYWADGSQAALPMTVCGYDWRALKTPKKNGLPKPAN